MDKLKEKIKRFFQGRYGIDELGKAIIIASAVIYLLGAVLKNSLLLCFAIAGMFYEIYRAMSRQSWNRGGENRIFDRYLKLWKLQYKERKTSRIYVCKNCGRMVRVPKGKGKIQVTCTVCGNKSIHWT